MTLTDLQSLAAMVFRLTNGTMPFVNLGLQCPVEVAALTALGASRRVTVTSGYKVPSVVTSAYLEVNGVRFESQYSRGATDDEIARLETEGRVTASGYKILPLE